MYVKLYFYCKDRAISPKLQTISALQIIKTCIRALNFVFLQHEAVSNLLFGCGFALYRSEFYICA